MILVGYHGTSAENAERIMKQKKFEPSTGNSEWLGHGIYFYENISDAKKWAKERHEFPVVLCVKVLIKNRINIIDFGKNKEHFLFETLKQLFLLKGYEIKSTLENQCNLMNFIWEQSGAELLAGSFAIRKTLFSTLTDGRPRRREFCIRDNSLITDITCVWEGKNE